MSLNVKGILAYFLSCWVFVGSIHWNYQAHYCMGRLQAFHFFSKADTCSLFAAELPSDCTGDDRMTYEGLSAGCCHDSEEVLTAFDSLLSGSGGEWFDADFVGLVPDLPGVVILDLLKKSDIGLPGLSIARPPPLSGREIGIRFQVFQI